MMAVALVSRMLGSAGDVPELENLSGAFSASSACGCSGARFRPQHTHGDGERLVVGMMAV
jgi:hypothetical protein